ncbi:hypothetical protein EZS27_013487 [termite gut metagenome]|uniref:Uncharacterized protein n=1 Tax=termite gut metagenome TaxID=433724 RepID=A0A5J4RYM9_9ZZZZ
MYIDTDSKGNLSINHISPEEASAIALCLINSPSSNEQMVTLGKKLTDEAKKAFAYKNKNQKTNVF